MGDFKEIIDSLSVRSRSTAQAAIPGAVALQVINTVPSFVNDQGVVSPILSGAGSLIFITVQGSDSGSAALSVPGAHIGAKVILAIDLTGIVDLLGGDDHTGATPYVEHTVSIANQVQQLLPYPGAGSVNLPLLIVNA